MIHVGTEHQFRLVDHFDVGLLGGRLTRRLHGLGRVLGLCRLRLGLSFRLGLELPFLFLILVGDDRGRRLLGFRRQARHLHDVGESPQPEEHQDHEEKKPSLITHDEATLEPERKGRGAHGPTHSLPDSGSPESRRVSPPIRAGNRRRESARLHRSDARSKLKGVELSQSIGRPLSPLTQPIAQEWLEFGDGVNLADR